MSSRSWCRLLLESARSKPCARRGYARSRGAVGSMDEGAVAGAVESAGWGLPTPWVAGLLGSGAGLQDAPDGAAQGCDLERLPEQRRVEHLQVTLATGGVGESIHG